MTHSVNDEWIAICYYTNPKFRRRFLQEFSSRTPRHMLQESKVLLVEFLAKLWNSIKGKTKAFIDGVKKFAGDVVPGAFIIGLSKLGDAGKKIWAFVSELAGEAYAKLAGMVDEFKAWLEKQKDQIVANILNLLLKTVLKVKPDLYNQLLAACEKGGIKTGLAPVPAAAPAAPAVKEGVVAGAVAATNAVGKAVNVAGSLGFGQAAENTPTSANPREIIGGLVENLFDAIGSILNDQLKREIVKVLFPIPAGSNIAIGALLAIPLAQQSGSLGFDMLVDFVTQVVATVKHLAAKASGKISLFREASFSEPHKILLEAKINTFENILVKHFDSLKGAIVGLIKGSNIEMLLRAAGGDPGAAKDVITQLLKLLVGAVKAKVKEISGKEIDAEPDEESVESAAEFLLNEKIIPAGFSLLELLYPQ
jgi:hypothetical protein